MAESNKTFRIWKKGFKAFRLLKNSAIDPHWTEDSKLEASFNQPEFYNSLVLSNL